METKTVKYINVNGKLMDLSHPQVMGILNVTPDSFYAGSRQQTEKDIINRTSQIIEEGASIIDIGAYSSRSNAEHISPEEEMRRLRTGLEIINRYHPGCVVSVDTFRADVARMCGPADVRHDCQAGSTLYYYAYARHAAKYANESAL